MSDHDDQFGGNPMALSREAMEAENRSFSLIRQASAKEAVLRDNAADREKARADAAEARVRELEAAASGLQKLHEYDVAIRVDTINALKAFDAKNKELEAQCAAMREALVLVWDPFDAHHESVKMRAALSGDAGRAMLERVEAKDRRIAALEGLRRAVKEAAGPDGSDDWADVFAKLAALDALETKR